MERGPLETPEAVYLFSSNIRPLYEQDILNLVAAPEGLTYRFRYKPNYVEDRLARLWGKTELEGRRCLVLFSLQQPGEYQDAAFVPVRLGQIRKTWREAGPIFVVEFRVDRAVSLAVPVNQDPSRDVPALRTRSGDADWYRQKVRDYRAWFTEQTVGCPYGPSASLGPDPVAAPEGPVAVGNDEGLVFQASTEYLAGTSSFQNAKFYRVLRLERRESDEWRPQELKPGVGYCLESGRAYQLVLLHSQPTNITSRAKFTVTGTQDVVQVGGQQGFEMASKYDAVVIPLTAVQLPSAGSREGTIHIHPEDGLQGPELLLPVVVELSQAKAVAAMAMMMVALILLAAPAAIALPQAAVTVFLVAGVFLTTIIPFAMSGKVPWG